MYRECTLGSRQGQKILGAFLESRPPPRGKRGGNSVLQKLPGLKGGVGGAGDKPIWISLASGTQSTQGRRPSPLKLPLGLRASQRPVCHSSHSSRTGPEASWLPHPCVWQVSQHLASLLGFLGKGCVPGWQLGWQGRRKEKSQVPGALPPGRTPGPSPLQPLKTTGGNFTITPGKQEG